MVPAKSHKDLWSPDKTAGRRSAQQSSVINMEHVDKKPELLELVEKVHASYNIVTKTMNDNRDYLERTFDDLSSSYNILAREMAEDMMKLWKEFSSLLSYLMIHRLPISCWNN